MNKGGGMDLAQRMKRYESVSRDSLVINMPVIVRVDGKAFHTLTKTAKKPFDSEIMDSMVAAALAVSKEMQGFVAAYVQSDEATFFISDYDDVKTQGWFNYSHSKLISISASVMSVNFTERYKKKAYFDSRAFNVPKEDVVNCFLWRAQDWKRNSLQMYARSFFSHKELDNKNSESMHEMLYQLGKNWAVDLSDQQKNGTFIIGERIRTDILPTYADISKNIETN